MTVDSESNSDDSPLVNDVHSRLNATRVAGIVRPRDIDQLRRTVADAALRKEALAISGGRHAMGGQQFATGGLLVDTTALCQPVKFDPVAGTIEMQAGAQWPEVIRATHHLGKGCWGIHQKQTGADSLTLGGSVSANA